MPGYDWSSLPDTARGAFGVFQRAAAERQTTSQVWDSIRSWADSRALADLRSQGNAMPSIDELAAASRSYTSGWNMQTVNAMRGEAGRWIGAKRRLHELQPQAAPTGNEIYRPPWATSPDIPGVQQAYRFRVKLSISPPGQPGLGESKWATVFSPGPLTSISDLLGGSLLQAIRDRYKMGGGPLNLATQDVAIEDYELEAV